MLPLAYPRLWLAVGILMIVAIVSGSLAPARDVESLMFVSDKVTHALAYATLTLWFTGVYARSRYPMIAIGLFALGATIEILQGAMALGRESDFRDLLANSTGIAVGMCLAWNWFGGWVRWVEALLRRIRVS